MKSMLFFITGCAILLLGAAAIIHRIKQLREDQQIREVYWDFSSAIILKDYQKAASYISSSYRSTEPDSNRIQLYWSVTNSSMNLDPHSFVMRDRSGIWIFPKATTSGNCGYGFVKETNGWKLNGELTTVLD
jgi:hypothetical protein